MYNSAGAGTTAVSGEKAALGNRFLAGLIDGIIVGFASSIIAVPIVLTGMVPWFLVPLVYAVIAFGLFTAANYGLLAKEGQTIGKKIMNLRIVKQDGSRPDVKDLVTKRYAIFWLVSAVPWIGGLVSLVNVCLVLRESRLAGHDEVAQTKVVNV